MKDKNTRKHVVAAVGKVIRNEIKQLCSRNAKSVQRTRDAIKLKQFNWDAIISEATEHAPNLTQILMECTKTTRKQSKAVQMSIVGMCLYYASTVILR